jgi:transposase
MNSCIATDYPIASSQTWAPIYNHQFREYYENSGIDVRYVSVAHPRANGQVERANGMVLDALKKRLHDAANSKGGKWIKELPNAL